MQNTSSLEVTAVIVSVDYGDILEETLPRNARFFSQVIVATTTNDTKTRQVIEAISNSVEHTTDVFYKRGAHFNKGAALEECFDLMGRTGWFVVMDADIVLPNHFTWWPLKVGCLYTPYRRMMPLTRPISIPSEENWSRLPLHRNFAEHAGYFQLASADDPVLRTRPWYPTNYKHAGTVDSLYQAKWLPHNKIRPNFEVLHIGDAGRNWCGRSSRMVDGTIPDKASERYNALREMISKRQGGSDRFKHERID